jgi:multidrug transporter EmrE-like cation transporter
MPDLPERISAQSRINAFLAYVDSTPKSRFAFGLIGCAGFFALLQFGLENLGVKLQFPLAALLSVVALFVLGLFVFPSHLMISRQIKVTLVLLLLVREICRKLNKISVKVRHICKSLIDSGNQTVEIFCR